MENSFTIGFTLPSVHIVIIRFTAAYTTVHNIVEIRHDDNHFHSFIQKHRSQTLSRGCEGGWEKASIIAISSRLRESSGGLNLHRISTAWSRRSSTIEYSINCTVVDESSNWQATKWNHPQWQFTFESVMRLLGVFQATYNDLLELGSNYILEYKEKTRYSKHHTTRFEPCLRILHQAREEYIITLLGTLHRVKWFNEEVKRLIITPINYS